MVFHPRKASRNQSIYELDGFDPVVDVIVEDVLVGVSGCTNMVYRVVKFQLPLGCVNVGLLGALTRG